MSQSPVIEFRVPLAFGAAEAAVREALQSQGFGILTEVDVSAVLKAKLGVETAPQKLLGACNPTLAHASLQAAPQVGAFLPCGVALRAGEAENETIVAIQNPAMLGELFDVPGLVAPADEAARRLLDALRTIGTAIDGAAGGAPATTSAAGAGAV